MTWQRIADVPEPPSSIGLSVASNATRAVIVGRSASGAEAWTSTDGSHWAASTDLAGLAGPAGGTGMTAVVAWADGFVAGGSADDPLHGKTASAVWTSADGLDWQRVEAVDGTFDDGHILGLAAGNGALVAVGTSDEETRGSGRAWISRDGTTWTRSDAGLATGIPRAVTVMGPEFTAVGLRSDDVGAMVWRTSDLATWFSVPDQPAFHAGTLPARLMSVIGTPDGIIAGGWRSDVAYGEAFVLRSTDGQAFVADPVQDSFYGAEVNGLAGGPVGSVAVGVDGYPDNDQGHIWVENTSR